MKTTTFFVLAFLLAVMLIGTGCRKSDRIKSKAKKPEKVLSQSADAVIQLSSDTVYIISSSIVLVVGQQMIIAPGTLIKMGTPDAPSGGSLTVNSGAALLANGTAEAPVIFTSNSKAGSQKTNWGGITITGKSYDNSRGTTGDAADYSGVLKYVRIEFGSLTLTAVGNRTIIDNVMVSYATGQAFSSNQAAIEIDGGTFNARHLITYATGGSADFYITRGYNGNLQHLLAVRHPFFGSTGSVPPRALCGMFIENNPSNPVGARPYTFPFISNLSVIGPFQQNGTTSSYLDTSLNIRAAALITTGSTCFRIRNSVLCGFPGSAWYMDDFETANNYQQGVSELKYSLLQAAYRDRLCYLLPTLLPPFTSRDFTTFALSANFGNKEIIQPAELGVRLPIDYDLRPTITTDSTTALARGSNFSGNDFSNAFYTKVNYVGAIGSDPWFQGWTNFTPLKTNYNFPD